MMAGDVSVAVFGGNLRIIGDQLDNHISVAETAPGTFTVTGLDGTTINQQPLGTSYDAKGVTNNVFIRMGDGDDTVDVHHAIILGNLDILTGGGNDGVHIVDTQVARLLHIDTGAGNDTVVLGGSPAADPAAAVDSTPAIDSPLPTGVRVRFMLDVHTGDGDDTVVVSDTHVEGNAVFDTGGGDDTISLGLAAVPVVAGVTPAGATLDPPGIWNVQIGRNLIVNTGAGNDTVRADSVRARMALFSLGDGNDRLIASNSSADHVFALLGDGDDVLDASGGGNTVGHLVLFGGPGDDTLIDGPNNQVAKADIYGIEHSI